MQGDWDEARNADCIALLFVFMIPIRHSIASFVDQWNSHHIRKQRNRSHHQAGKPWVMFFMPDPEVAIPCEVPLNHLKWQELMDLVEEDGVDLDKYLTDPMMILCTDIILEFRPEPGVSIDHTQPYLDRYLYLRSALQKHEN